MKEETCGSCHTMLLTSRVNSDWKTWRSEGIKVGQGNFMESMKRKCQGKVYGPGKLH